MIVCPLPSLDQSIDILAPCPAIFISCHRLPVTHTKNRGGREMSIILCDLQEHKACSLVTTSENMLLQHDKTQ